MKKSCLQKNQSDQIIKKYKESEQEKIILDELCKFRQFTIKTEYPLISECDIDAIVSLYDGNESSEVICEK